MSQKKTYTRYLVIKVEVEVNAAGDQNPDDYLDDAIDALASELDYSVEFDGEVDCGDAGNPVKLSVKVTDTEVLGLLLEDPV